ncbi:MAG: hypothetical protein ACOCUV_03780 [bacterium]
MGFLGNLFRNKKKVAQKKVVYGSVPDYISSANKIHEKRYDEAIVELKEQLDNTPQDNAADLAMIHINLLQAYFKSRNENPDHFDLSTHHAKEALKYGHNTGFAADRIIINLEKQKRYNHAIEVCEVLISNEYHILQNSKRTKETYVEKLEKLKNKLEKHGDKNSENFFSEEEKIMIINNSKIGISPVEPELSEEEVVKKMQAILRGED